MIKAWRCPRLAKLGAAAAPMRASKGRDAVSGKGAAEELHSPIPAFAVHQRAVPGA